MIIADKNYFGSTTDLNGRCSGYGDNLYPGEKCSLCIGLEVKRAVPEYVEVFGDECIGYADAPDNKYRSVKLDTVHHICEDDGFPGGVLTIVVHNQSDKMVSIACVFIKVAPSA